MKTNKQTTLTTALALVIGLTGVTLGTSAMAGDHMKKRGQFKMMAKKLNLSEEQRVALKTQMQTMAQEFKADKEDRQAFQAQLQALVKASSFDEAAVRALFAAKEEDKVAKQVNKAKAKHDFWNMLDAEQQATLAEMPMKRKKMKKPSFNQLRLLKKLDLNAEQKDQIGALIKQQMAEFDPFDDSRQTNAETMQSLVRTANLDEAAVAKLAAEQYQQKTDRMIDRLKVKNQIWNLLTPEQQQQADSIMEARKAKMEKRMAKVKERRQSRTI